MKRIVRIASAAAMCALVQAGAVAVAVPQAVHGGYGAAALLRVSHNTVTSSNWSGYGVQAAHGNKFTDVQGSWVEPKVRCVGSQQFASFWVGIDGYTSQSVEQLGSDSDCDGTNPGYYAWFEMYPLAPVTLSSRRYPVTPGDTLTASVSVSGGQFTLGIMSSRGWTFSKTLTSQSAVKQSSAEWIAEAPASQTQILPLADFGTVHFMTCTAAIDGGASMPISSFTADGGPHAIDMTTGDGAARATPTSLNPRGKAFNVTWSHD